MSLGVAMKRELDEADERPVSQEEWGVIQGCFTEACERDLDVHFWVWLRWWQTCRTMWHRYQARPLLERFAAVRRRMEHQVDLTRDSRLYVHRHAHARMRQFSDFLRMNHCLWDMLAGINYKLAMDDRDSAFLSDPLLNVKFLCKLLDVGKRLDASARAAFNRYYYCLLCWSARWVRLHTGWDLVVSDEDTASDFSKSLCRLEGQSNDDLFDIDMALYACNAQYLTVRNVALADMTPYVFGNLS